MRYLFNSTSRPRAPGRRGLARLRRRELLAAVTAVVGLGATALITPAANAQQPRSATTGELSPLIAFHKDAVHASLVPQGGSFDLCFWMRPSEYSGTDLVDPDDGPLGKLRTKFAERVYGDFGFSTGLNGLDESNMTRIKDDLARENVQCLDLDDPAAFADAGTRDVAEVTPGDAALNQAAFRDAGYSKGLYYNLFCAGHALLPDGRLMVAGGHDKSGNNGIRKINIFDPGSGTWAPRPQPQVRSDFESDPFGDVPPNADPLNEANTDPPHPSDMRYQRWYPTTVPLPDGKVLILSGSDQDSSQGRVGAPLTKVRQVVPEVYDPSTDTTVALENAEKKFAMYPRAYVVQTGPGRDDWKVAVTAEVSNDPTGDDLRAYDPFTYNGNTYLLDVQGALADPARDTKAQKHWQLVSTAAAAHESGAGAALWTLNGQGLARQQRTVLFGGDSGTEDGGPVDTIEMIDFQNTDGWRLQPGRLAQAVTQNNAVALPDGNVLVVGGVRGRGPGRVTNLQLQMFHPESGRVTNAVTSPIPRHDHSTTLLLPDGRVIIMGGNRTDLGSTVDAGVPVAELYSPPYLFKGPRPAIESAPTEIEYGSRFDLGFSGPNVESVVLVRSGPVTHNWDWGNRMIKLAVDRVPGDPRAVSVRAPALPALAVPGYYMMFAVSKDGVPSVATRVHFGVPSS